jgi:hypothetical protein
MNQNEAIIIGKRDRDESGRETIQFFWDGPEDGMVPFVRCMLEDAGIIEPGAAWPETLDSLPYPLPWPMRLVEDVMPFQINCRYYQRSDIGEATEAQEATNESGGVDGDTHSLAR